MSKRASNDTFDQLHGLVADSLIAQIKKYTSAGEAIPAPLLAQATKFLKDNGIDQPARSGNKTDTLKDAMPTYDDDNIVPFAKP